MLPLETYQHTAERARRYLKWHDGLINTRQRSIRADWRESFCRLMHWRLCSPIERVDSRDAVVVLREGATLCPSDFSAENVEDLLRAGLTFGMSALDRYVHERVVKRFITGMRANKLTRQQESYSIPTTVVLEIIDRMNKAHRENQTVRGSNDLRKSVQELLHRRPFQSWREIDNAFKLAGITNLSGRLQGEYHVGDMKPIKAQLNKIADRRNHIVHEGDLIRHQRGGSVQLRPLARKYVGDSLDFLDTLVAKMERIV